MEKSEKGQFNEQIWERTIKMAVGIHELLVATKVSPITRPIVNQIIRSLTISSLNTKSFSFSKSFKGHNPKQSKFQLPLQKYIIWKDNSL